MEKANTAWDHLLFNFFQLFHIYEKISLYGLAFSGAVYIFQHGSLEYWLESTIGHLEGHMV